MYHAEPHKEAVLCELILPLATPLALVLHAHRDAPINCAACSSDQDYAIFLGAFPRKDGMERKDVMEKNIGIFNSQERHFA